MRIIISAGPTREYIDAIRFISNSSSGKMGYEIARAAAEMGEEVLLVSGPVALPKLEGVRLIEVVSCQEMASVISAEFEQADALIMAAAVSDYCPSRRYKGKLKKSDEELLITLVPNPDILAELGKKRGEKILVGFALETENAEKNALAKLRRKNLDFIVLNSPESLGSETATVKIIKSEAEIEELTDVSKATVAKRVITLVREIKRSR